MSKKRNAATEAQIQRQQECEERTQNELRKAYGLEPISSPEFNEPMLFEKNDLVRSGNRI